MWIKFKKPKRGKPTFEMGPRRQPGDPVFDDLENLRKAVNEFKNAVKNQFKKDLQWIKTIFRRK